MSPERRKKAMQFTIVYQEFAFPERKIGVQTPLQAIGATQAQPRRNPGAIQAQFRRSKFESIENALHDFPAIDAATGSQWHNCQA